MTAGEQAVLPLAVAVGGFDLVVWPLHQRILPLSAPLMAVTQFDDHVRHHVCGFSRDRSNCVPG